MQGLKHASNLKQAISHDKFQPRHWPLIVYIALLVLYALRCVRKAGNCAKPGVNRGRMLLLSGLKCRSNNAVLKCATAFLSRPIYIQAFQMTVRDNYRLCIVVQCTACWRIITLRLYRQETLDGWCIHKFIMPSSRTETDRLQYLENRNNTTIYRIAVKLHIRYMY